MKSHPGVTATMFETWRRVDQHRDDLHSSIRISCVVRDSVVEDAVGRLPPPSASLSPPPGTPFRLRRRHS